MKKKYPWTEKGRKKQRSNYCRFMRAQKTKKQNKGNEGS